MVDFMHKTSTGTAAVTTTSGATTSSSVTITFGAIPSGQAAAEHGNATPAPDKIEAAVYAHIRAVRALGRTKIDTAEIARALNIPPAAVIKAVGSLKNKGVKALT